MIPSSIDSTSTDAEVFRSRFFDFCQAAIHLDGKLIEFNDRPYLPDVYASLDTNLILRASRQVEKSTFLVNRILYEACTHPGRRILFVAPRENQAIAFCSTRLHPAIQESPLVQKLLGYTRPPKLGVKMLKFPNGSQVFIRPAYRSADATRGISADILICDEFQDLANGCLPVLQETLSHSAKPITILTGTPKLITNHLETAFVKSTARQWTVTCPGCGEAVTADERSIGPEYPICRHCNGPIDFSTGSWVPSNPGSTWGEGFWLNHLMASWIKYRDLLDRRESYDDTCFKNETLGLPTSYGDITVTIAELEACCTPRPMARTAAEIPPWARATLTAGIDWGGGTSPASLVMASLDEDNVFHVWHCASIPRAQGDTHTCQEVAHICSRFGVQFVMADADGNGTVSNRILQGLLGEGSGSPITAIQYGNADTQPMRDGVLFHKQIHRSKWIGGLIGRVKRKAISFPSETDCRHVLAQIACEQATFDDQTRTIAFSHPEGHPDDFLHALTYGLAGATSAQEKVSYYGG